MGVSKGRANLHEGLYIHSRPSIRPFGPTQGLRCTGLTLFQRAFPRFDTHPSARALLILRLEMPIIVIGKDLEVHISENSSDSEVEGRAFRLP